MPQKIYDIKPPENDCKNGDKNCNQKKSKKGFFLGLVFSFLALFGIFYFFAFNVEIEIWPKTEGFSLQKDFLLNVNKEELQNDVLGATIFRTDFFEEERIFTATGVKDSESKARGIITIQNRHWDSNQPLIEGTRFEAEDGKIFRATDGIIVPGRRYQGGEIIPGEVRVEVIADEPGRSYNIEPTTFTLPGLKGAPSFEGVTAISTESMIGGAIGERVVISEEDIENAKSEIIKSLVSQGKNLLESRQGDKYLLREDTQYNYEIEEEIVSGRAGEEKDSFSVKIRAKIEVITFDKEDFNSLLKRALLAEVDKVEENGIKSEIDVYENSLSYTYLISDIDWVLGTGKVKVDFVGETYFKINNPRLIEMAVGSSKNELEQTLRAEDFIRDAVVRFKPFGIGNIPENGERIKIITSFN